MNSKENDDRIKEYFKALKQARLDNENKTLIISAAILRGKNEIADMKSVYFNVVIILFLIAFNIFPLNDSAIPDDGGVDVTEKIRHAAFLYYYVLDSAGRFLSMLPFIAGAAAVFLVALADILAGLKNGRTQGKVGEFNAYK